MAAYTCQGWYLAFALHSVAHITDTEKKRWTGCCDPDAGADNDAGAVPQQDPPSAGDTADARTVDTAVQTDIALSDPLQMLSQGPDQEHPTPTSSHSGAAGPPDQQRSNASSPAKSASPAAVGKQSKQQSRYSSHSAAAQRSHAQQQQAQRSGDLAVAGGLGPQPQPGSAQATKADEKIGNEQPVAGKSKTEGSPAGREGAEGLLHDASSVQGQGTGTGQGRDSEQGNGRRRGVSSKAEARWTQGLQLPEQLSISTLASHAGVDKAFMQVCPQLCCITQKCSLFCAMLYEAVLHCAMLNLLCYAVIHQPPTQNIEEPACLPVTSTTNGHVQRATLVWQALTFTFRCRNGLHL